MLIFAIVFGSVNSNFVDEFLIKLLPFKLTFVVDFDKLNCINFSRETFKIISLSILTAVDIDPFFLSNSLIDRQLCVTRSFLNCAHLMQTLSNQLLISSITALQSDYSSLYTNFILLALPLSGELRMIILYSVNTRCCVDLYFQAR